MPVARPQHTNDFMVFGLALFVRIISERMALNAKYAFKVPETFDGTLMVGAQTKYGHLASFVSINNALPTGNSP